MKVIRVDRTGGPEVLVAAESDAPRVAAGELLIRQTAIGLNYIDVYLRTGAYPHALPFVPGREGVGIVEAVGSGVAGFTAGMRVGYPDSPNLGSYAERVAVPARFCVEVPAGIDDAVACGAMLQALTAQYLATDSGGPEKTALAKSAGADHVIDYRAVDFEPEVKAITGGAGVEAVYDAVGKDTWERSLRSLRVRGSFVLYGAASGKVPPIDPATLQAAGSVFFSRPTFGHFARTHGELSDRATEVFDAILDGSLQIRISNTYPLAGAAQAHRDLEARKTSGKSILVP